MTEAIQRNAANILALSLLLFTKATAVTENMPIVCSPEQPQDTLCINPSNKDIAPSLITA